MGQIEKGYRYQQTFAEIMYRSVRRGSKIIHRGEEKTRERVTLKTCIKYIREIKSHYSRRKLRVVSKLPTTREEKFCMKSPPKYSSRVGDVSCTENRTTKEVTLQMLKLRTP